MFLPLAGAPETWVTMERELLLSPSLFPEAISQPTVLNQTTRGLKLTVSDARSIIQSKNSIFFLFFLQRTISAHAQRLSGVIIFVAGYYIANSLIICRVTVRLSPVEREH